MVIGVTGIDGASLATAFLFRGYGKIVGNVIGFSLVHKLSLQSFVEFDVGEVQWIVQHVNPDVKRRDVGIDKVVAALDKFGVDEKAYFVAKNVTN